MLKLLLIAEGFIGLAFQLLFIRQLTPEVGASAVTTSWIVGIFLLFLAVGYRMGGAPVPAPLEKFGMNLSLTGLIGGIGATPLVIALFFTMIKPLVGTLVSLIIYSLLFVGPVAYYMGQSLPLLIQRSKSGKNPSELSGNALYWSTIGSFFGAVFTTNVLYNLLGSSATLFLCAALSLTIGLILLSTRGRIFAGAAFVTVTIISTQTLSIYHPAIAHNTAFADIYIKDLEDNRRVLFANNSAMSIIDSDSKLNTTEYLRDFHRVLNQHKVIDSEILVLGAGGFLAHTQNYAKNRYTYVDIDADLKDIVEKDFVEKPLDVPFVVSDARRYLIDTEKKYDVIMLDVFSSKMAIPPHLVTKEFFELAKSRIHENGLLIVNAILDPKFNDVYSRRFHATLSEVFPYCNYRTNDVNSGIGNLVYACQRKTEDNTIYVDDRNYQETDFWQSKQKY